MVEQGTLEKIDQVPEGGIVNPSNILLNGSKVRILIHSKLNCLYKRPKMNLTTINKHLDELQSIENVIKYDLSQAFYWLDYVKRAKFVKFYKIKNV